MASVSSIISYLVGDKSYEGYLMDPDNNSKIVMISGKWGTGKTHFWNEIISPKIYQKLPQGKSISYVSLYGKNSLEEIKTSVYLSSGNSLLSKDVAAFGISALSAIKDSDLAIGKALKSGVDLWNSKKIQKEINKLRDGGIICFDDFERKSKSVDLNDLFGFISQLAINLKCKIIIILNDDAFKGKEKHIFQKVKEKTVNKFLYFKPSKEELYNAIFNSKTYEKYILPSDKEIIKNAIIKSGEINARIYQQVLDNCYEWKKMQLPSLSLEALVFTTIYFILSHKVLDYAKLKKISQDDDSIYQSTSSRYSLHYKLYNTFSLEGTEHIFNISATNKQEYLNKVVESNNNFLYKKIQKYFEKKEISESVKSQRLKELKEQENDLILFWKYGYKLYFMDKIDEKDYLIVKQYVSTGILHLED